MREGVGKLACFCDGIFLGYHQAYYVGINMERIS